MQKIEDFRDQTISELPHGSKYRFRLPVSREATGEELAIPVWVARGADDGPILGVVAGTHGNEHEGQTALHRWWAHLDASQIAGTVVAIPHLNILSAMVYERVSPYDRLDLNRICPGNANGYGSERIADLFFRHVATQIESLVDIHSGGPMTDTMPCTLYRDPTGSVCAKDVVELAKATLVPALWIAPTRLGGAGCSISEECLNRDIPAVTYEMGGRGALLDDCVANIRRALDNVLVLLGIMEGKPENLTRYDTVSGWFTHADTGGLYLPRYRPGDRIEAGAQIGELYDFFGDRMQTFTAEKDGILLSQRVSTIQPGDWVYALGEFV